MAEDQKEIEVFINSFLKALEKGLHQKYYVSDGIEFELAVVKTKSVGGGISILMADAKGKYSNEKISKVKFKVKEIQDGIRFRGTESKKFH